MNHFTALGNHQKLIQNHKRQAKEASISSGVNSIKLKTGLKAFHLLLKYPSIPLIKLLQINRINRSDYLLIVRRSSSEKYPESQATSKQGDNHFLLLDVK